MLDKIKAIGSINRPDYDCERFWDYYELIMVHENEFVYQIVKGWLKKTYCRKKNPKSIYMIQNLSFKDLYDKIYTIGYYSGFYSSLKDKI